jgi:hypothetical protein
MSYPLNGYMRRFGRLAPLRLCVRHPFCAETNRDSCNLSLQLFTTKPYAGRASSSSKLRYQRYPRNPRLNENYQTNPCTLGSQISGFEISDWGHSSNYQTNPTPRLWRFLYRFRAGTVGLRATRYRFLRNEPIPEGKERMNGMHRIQDRKIIKRSHALGRPVQSSQIALTPCPLPSNGRGGRAAAMRKLRNEPIPMDRRFQDFKSRMAGRRSQTAATAKRTHFVLCALCVFVVHPKITKRTQLETPKPNLKTPNVNLPNEPNIRCA